MKKDHYLSQIIASAEQYDIKLNNKIFLFCYKANRQFSYLTVKFDQRNFKHLIGIKSALNAKEFYVNCISHKLYPQAYQATNNTAQKLVAMRLFLDLHKLSASIGEPFHSRLNIQADIMISKFQSILCLVKSNKYYFPQSLLNKVDPHKEMKTRYPILMTCVRDSNRLEYQISYLKKDCSSKEIIHSLPIVLQSKIQTNGS